MKRPAIRAAADVGRQALKRHSMRDNFMVSVDQTALRTYGTQQATICTGNFAQDRKAVSMLRKRRSTGKHLPRGLEILYEDRDILVVDKPAGLLTVGTETNKLKTAAYILTDYVRKGHLKSRNRIFIVHRLDQWTSGVLIFAKSEEVKLRLQAQWKDTEKRYVAVVYGHLAQKEGIITSYLSENSAYVVYSTTDVTRGKLAQTAYKVLKETKQFSLLEINLLTGRKNQIRVHMADKGHPIVGDRKYGKAKDGYSRLALHSRLISFKHPTSGELMTFESKVPEYFNKLVGNIEVRM